MFVFVRNIANLIGMRMVMRNVSTPRIKPVLPHGTVIERRVVFEGKVVKCIDRPLTPGEEEALFEEIEARRVDK